MPITTAPTTADVALHLRDHLYDEHGNAGTDFTTVTNPTLAQAQRAITEANAIVRGRVGTVPDDAEGDYWEAAAALVVQLAAIRAAITLVRPLPNAEPEHDRLRDDYRELLPDVKAAMQEAAAGEDPSDIDDAPSASGMGAFPAAMTSLDEEF
jgi:hypothetical protein